MEENEPKNDYIYVKSPTSLREGLGKLVERTNARYGSDFNYSSLIRLILSRAAAEEYYPLTPKM